VKRKLMLALALASLALAARSDAGENLKLNPKLDYSGDSQDGPLITGDRMEEGAAAGKPNYVLIVGEG
jgi:hypothetical protein